MKFIISAGRAAGLILAGLVFIAVPMAAFKLGLLPLAQSVLGLGGHLPPWVRPAGMLTAMMLGYWAFVRHVERRPASELSLRPAQALLGIGLGAGLIGAAILILYALGFYRLVSYQGLGGLAVIVPPIIAAAFFEELVFRGLMFATLDRRFGFVAALAVQSLIFAALHLFNAGFGGWIDLIAGLLIGGFWTCLYALWRNIWSVSLHHAAWNLTIAVTGLPLSGLSDFRAVAPFRSTFQGPPLMSGGAGGPEPSVISLAIAAAALGVAFYLVRRRGRPMSPPPGS